LGSLDALTDYNLIHPVNNKLVIGKVFLKDATKASGTQISFNTLLPHSEQPYFHIHRKNEESYIILKGSGLFQVDQDCFPIKEGSVIRVAPAGIRGICNTSDVAMVYMVVQSKEDSMEEHTTDDGERIPYVPQWRNS
jgi:mannose-6-phosphate isomerase-like protein (cupin superfamily)